MGILVVLLGCDMQVVDNHMVKTHPVRTATANLP